MKAYQGIAVLALLAWAQTLWTAQVELKQEDDIKTQAEIKEQKEHDIQLMTIFLDDSESRQNATKFAITPTFLTAILNKAGIIIASSSLLYNIMEGPYAKNKSEIATAFQKIFNNGADWIIKEVTEHLLFMIPKASPAAGLKLATMTDITIDEIINRYKILSQDQWDQLYFETGNRFVGSLNSIFEAPTRSPEWIIYLDGHGNYQSSIACIPLEVFSQLLDFFNKKINVALFVYSSCYAAGYNAAQIYGELTEASSAKEYRFPIVTDAIGDMPTKGWIITHDPIINTLSSTGNFKLFMQVLNANQYDYERALVHIMPDLQTYGNISNIPQIRFRYIPAWFPVTQSKDAVIRITKTMAVTRDKSLILPALKAKSDPKAILLYTKDVPFEIILNTQDAPYFIITQPGDVTVRIEQLTIQRPTYTIARLFQKFSIERLLKTGAVSTSYKGKKIVFIKKVGLAGSAHDYLDVIFDISEGTIYYTNALTKKPFIVQQEKAPRLFEGDYLAQFSTTIFKDADELALRRLQLQKLGHKVRQSAIVHGDNPQELQESIEKIEHQIQNVTTKINTLRPFQEAIDNDDLQTIQKLIQEGISIETRLPDYQGSTPLIYAAIQGKTGIVQFLLDQGAEVNARDRLSTNIDTRGKTALSSLARHSLRNRLAITKLLLDHGADVLVFYYDATFDSHVTPFEFRFTHTPPDEKKPLYDLLMQSFRQKIATLQQKIDDNKVLTGHFMQELDTLYNTQKVGPRIIHRVNEMKEEINRLYLSYRKDIANRLMQHLFTALTYNKAARRNIRKIMERDALIIQKAGNPANIKLIDLLKVLHEGNLQEAIMIALKEHGGSSSVGSDFTFTMFEEDEYRKTLAAITALDACTFLNTPAQGNLAAQVQAMIKEEKE